MEICPVTGRFPVTRLRLGQPPSNFLRTRTPKPELIRCESPITNLRRRKTNSFAPENRNRMFILGIGFVGQYFAHQLIDQGWVVSGTCTNMMKKKKLEEMGFNVHLFDANDPEPEILNDLNDHTHLLVSIPPLVGIGDPMVQHENLLKSRLMNGNLKWLCYLSSTGVYGNCNGAWVDEDYTISPTSEVVKARLAAEERWLQLGHALGLSAQVFRLGGIYGPGRSAIDTIIKQRSLSESQRRRSSKNFTSRIHVADICQALKASIYNESPGRRIYNIVDDNPAPREEVFRYALDLIEKKWPNDVLEQTYSDTKTESLPSSNSDRITRERGEKRVCNARMKTELGVQLLHPSYKSGLKSILESIHSLHLSHI